MFVTPSGLGEDLEGFKQVSEREDLGERRRARKRERRETKGWKGDGVVRLG